MEQEKYPAPELQPGEEIEILRERIEKLEAQIEKEPTTEKKEKAVKQEIKSYLKEMQQAPSFAPPVSTRDEAEEIEKFEPSQQVGALIGLVFAKGLTRAISVVKDLNNPAILDELHDALIDRYYQMMIEKKILKL